MTSSQSHPSPHPPTQPALIVFAKRPEPGAVKTRLTPTLSSNEAAELYEAFLRDALDQYVQLDVAVRLYLTPPAAPLPDYLTEFSISIHEQDGPDLGGRMLRAFAETFDAGHERAVVIGTDHPTLPSSFIRHAFVALDGPPAISIGPSADGGYYLLGMNRRFPVLFKDMAYSHAQVFSETLERARQTDAQLTVLPEWYDVDTPDALGRLIDEIGEIAQPIPRIRAVVSKLGVTRRL